MNKRWMDIVAREIACLIPLFMVTAGAANAQSRFHVIEATIDGIHAELQVGRLSCVQLVQAYLNRIKPYDQVGPEALEFDGR